MMDDERPTDGVPTVLVILTALVLWCWLMFWLILPPAQAPGNPCGDAHNTETER